jgi:hypothetical protein
MENITISRETFAALLSFTKWARNSFEEHFKNSSRHLHDSPSNMHWQQSMNFWQQEAQRAENTYKKALKEVVYS